MTKLVLLPGLDGTGGLFAPFIDAVSSKFDVQVVHYPKEQVIGYKDLVNLAHDALPKDDSYFVLGESFSGPIAIALATDVPLLMRGMIRCCTFARNPRPILTACSH